jgi:hypothetical protein
MSNISLETILSGIDEWNSAAAEGTIDVQEIDLLLNTYLTLCGDLTKTDPDTIVRAQQILGRAITTYAYHRSPVYRDLIDISVLKDKKCLNLIRNAFQVNKFDLLDKSRWYTEDFSSTENSTSGTTGAPFKYKVWNDAFVPIEKDRHYGNVLDEYGLTGEVNVLYMVSGFKPSNSTVVEYGKAKIKVAEGDDIANYVARILASHGRTGAKMHHIEFGEDAYFNIKDYCDFLVKYSQDKKIDVLLASGGLYELLCTHLITSESTEYPHLYKLLSNTGDRVNRDTLEFLVEAGVANNWCDHMRCWDGGVSFFTCEHHTYHLLEDLAYVYSDESDKLVSVDFFSYPSPFVNYSNGDYCQVEEKWEKCDCGRWHRPFKFMNRRPRSNRNRSGSYYDTQRVHKFLTEKYDVKFVSYQDNLISVEDSTLSDESKVNIVRDMAKEHIAVHFFTQKNLRSFITMQKVSNPA